MMTRITHGNLNQISEMWKMLSMISMSLTPPPHAPSPLIQQISFCFSKTGRSCLLSSTRAIFLLITWKSIFRRGIVLQSHSKGLHFNGLSQFSFFHLILSNHFRLWTMRSFSTRTHLSHALHIFTNTCLPHGKPCSIKLNLILDSSFLCCAWLCCHTHVHHTCLCFSSILPLPCGRIMLLISAVPALDSIGSLVQTCMHLVIVYKGQGIDWHPQSDSLGVSL